MESRTLSNLEYGKVLERLASFAVSEAGAKACRSISPYADAQDACQATELFRQGRQWVQTSRIRLAPFPALDGMFAFVDANNAVLDLDDLFALKQTLAQARAIVDSLSDETGRSAPVWPMLTEMVSRYPWPGQVWSSLTRCIAEDGRLKDESSPDLLLVRQSIRRIHQSCTSKAKAFIASHNLLQYMQDEYITLASDRYVLPLRSNFKGRVPGIIHDYSQTGETCYFEPMFLVEINNELQELKQQEREEERKILAFLTGLFRSERDAVHSVYGLLVLADVLLAKCALADAFSGTALDITEVPADTFSTRTASGANVPAGQVDEADSFNPSSPASPIAFSPAGADTLHLVNARHPLLALTDAGALPVDITLKSGQRALVISGGNAGGKTVCLKTLGLIGLMAMSGLPVPVDAGSSMPAWTQFFAFIGDEQSLEESVSTFTAQVQHLSRAWQMADTGTLVILDEFGAGTDPAQGAALAQAVIDELLERGAMVAAATHFPALKAYALSKEGVRAASVLFDPHTKKPLYRLAYDQVGASQAIDVAREHGMPEAVLQRAQNYLLMDGEDTSALIERLNSLAVTREQELAALKREQKKFTERKAKLEKQTERERKELFTEMQAQSQAILREWKSGKASHKQALKEMAKAREKLVAPVTSQPKAEALRLEDITPGQHLWYLPWNKQAKVEEVDGRRKKIKIDLSGVAMWAALTDVALHKESEKSHPVTGSRGIGNAAGGQKNISKPSSGMTMRVDLRGMRADVAINELSRFIDKAILMSATTVEIIHGRGTGALRKEVHRSLDETPAVAEHRLAPEDLGGDGMTIAELR